MASSRTKAPPRGEYDKDEKCLCFHGRFLYEAKILDMRLEDPQDRKSAHQYRVHYKGWKNTWDSWVPEDRLRKPTEENKELAANLFKELKNQQREERDQKAAAKKGTGSATKRKSETGGLRDNYRTSEERSSSVQAPARGTKRGRDWEIEKEEAFTSKPSIRIPLPDHIKGLLVDDWENISKNLSLVPLPHQYPVSEILSAYKAAELPSRREGSADYDILEEVIAGVKEYFDKSIGRMLLYRFERQQWAEIYARINQGADEPLPPSAVKNSILIDRGVPLAGKSPSDVYGAEHLARLFVSMPELLAQTNMDAPSVSRLKEELHKMTKWIGKRSDAYFEKEYMDPGEDYKDNARGAASL